MKKTLSVAPRPRKYCSMCERGYIDRDRKREILRYDGWRLRICRGKAFDLCAAVVSESMMGGED